MTLKGHSLFIPESNVGMIDNCHFCNISRMKNTLTVNLYETYERDYVRSIFVTTFSLFQTAQGNFLTESPNMVECLEIFQFYRTKLLSYVSSWMWHRVELVN